MPGTHVADHPRAAQHRRSPQPPAPHARSVGCNRWLDGDGASLHRLRFREALWISFWRRIARAPARRRIDSPRDRRQPFHAPPLEAAQQGARRRTTMPRAGHGPWKRRVGTASVRRTRPRAFCCSRALCSPKPPAGTTEAIPNQSVSPSCLFRPTPSLTCGRDACASKRRDCQVQRLVRRPRTASIE